MSPVEFTSQSKQPDDLIKVNDQKIASSSLLAKEMKEIKEIKNIKKIKNIKEIKEIKKIKEIKVIRK